jgi:hypothetical protein
MAKLGITEVKRKLAVASNTHNLMAVLDQHLREDCSDAEKLANIDSFMRDYMTSSQMDMRHFVSKLDTFVAK